jgi:hypothetical protein
MVHVTLRLPKHVLDHYDGDTRAMRDAWVRYVETLPYPVSKLDLTKYDGGAIVTNKEQTTWHQPLKSG